jgi:hypothetical protein
MSERTPALDPRMNDNDDVRQAVALVILRHVDQGESDSVRLSDVTFRELAGRGSYSGRLGGPMSDGVTA